MWNPSIESLSRDELCHRQGQELRSMVERVYHNVAFYRDKMQRLGLTWVYRALHEPGRLGPRYFRYNAVYLYYTLRERMARRSTAV